LPKPATSPILWRRGPSGSFRWTAQRVKPRLAGDRGGGPFPNTCSAPWVSFRGVAGLVKRAFTPGPFRFATSSTRDALIAAIWSYSESRRERLRECSPQ